MPRPYSGVIGNQELKTSNSLLLLLMTIDSLKLRVESVWSSECMGRVAQLVERANPGEEVLGSVPTVADGALLVGSVSV